MMIHTPPPPPSQLLSIKEMHADDRTKALAKPALIQFRKMIGIERLLRPHGHPCQSACFVSSLDSALRFAHKYGVIAHQITRTNRWKLHTCRDQGQLTIGKDLTTYLPTEGNVHRETQWVAVVAANPWIMWHWSHQNRFLRKRFGISACSRCFFSLISCIEAKRIRPSLCNSCGGMWKRRHHPNPVEAPRKAKERICDDQRNSRQRIGLPCITNQQQRRPHVCFSILMIDEFADHLYT